MQELFKALPFDPDIRAKLLTEYETYDDALKTEIIHECYGAFFKLEKAIKDTITATYMAEVAQGKRQLNTQFHDDVEKAAWAEIEARINGKQDQQDELQDVRKQLEAIMGSVQN